MRVWFSFVTFCYVCMQQGLNQYMLQGLVSCRLCIDLFPLLMFQTRCLTWTVCVCVLTCSLSSCFRHAVWPEQCVSQDRRLFCPTWWVSLLLAQAGSMILHNCSLCWNNYKQWFIYKEIQILAHTSHNTVLITLQIPVNSQEFYAESSLTHLLYLH